MRSFVCVFFLLLFTIYRAKPDTVKTSGDRETLRQAVRITDPQKRLDALRQFMAKYPKSQRSGRAQALILKTLASYFPDRDSELKQQVKLMLKAADKDKYGRFDDYLEVADTLANAGAMLPTAEEIQKKALKMLNQKAYFAGERKIYARAKVAAPSDQEISRFFAETRGRGEAGLALTYYKQGRIPEAAKEAEAAAADNSSNEEANAVLGMVEAKEGHKEAALQHLTKARLMGPMEPQQESELESLYKGLPESESKTLEAYLDSQYAALFPPPFEAAKYKGESKAGGRTVLAELFTGAGCEPCAGADLAMDGDLERYSREQVAFIAFDQHIPEPDPLTIPAGVKRFDYYEGKGTPTMAVDGKTTIVGSDREGAKKRFEKNNELLEKALAVAPEARLQLNVEGNGEIVMVHVVAGDVHSDGKNLRLQIALVENKLSYSGENGIRFHPMVVRSMAGDNGFTLNAGKNAAVDYSFNISKISQDLRAYLDAYEQSNDRFGPMKFSRKMDQIDANDLSVVAFVQDDATKHVLQAAYAPVENGKAQ